MRAGSSAKRRSARRVLPALSLTEEFAVVFPVAANFGHDALVFRIAMHVVPVLVTLKPRIVMVPQLHRPSQPDESLLFVAEQGVNPSQPISPIAIGFLRWLRFENLRINLVSLTTRGVQEGSEIGSGIVATPAAEFHCPGEDHLGFRKFPLVVKNFAEVGHGFPLVRIRLEQLAQLLFSFWLSSEKEQGSCVHPVPLKRRGVQLVRATIGLLPQFQQASVMVDVA